VQPNLKGGQIKNISRRKEDGWNSMKSKPCERENAGLRTWIPREPSWYGRRNALTPFPGSQARHSEKGGDGKLGTIETFSKPGQPMMMKPPPPIRRARARGERDKRGHTVSYVIGVSLGRTLPRIPLLGSELGVVYSDSVGYR